MPTVPLPPKRLAFKDRYQHPHLAPPPGEQTVAAKWQEFTDTPFFKDACQVAYGEYVSGLTPDLQAPGTMAYKVVGAKEVLNVLAALGEPDRPYVAGESSKQLTPIK